MYKHTEYILLSYIHHDTLINQLLIVYMLTISQFSKMFYSKHRKCTYIFAASMNLTCKTMRNITVNFDA